MPVKWVLYWQPNQGSTVSTQILNEAAQCVESINGVKEGRWKAALNYYKPMLRDQSTHPDLPRDFLGISLADQPTKYYFLIRSQRLVVEADASIQLIMEKLQSYKSKVSIYFDGFQYLLGDFRLRVGRVVPVHSETIRGIVMEVEYLPISSMEKARKVMEEFVEIWHEALSKTSLSGKFVNIELNFGEFGLADTYTPQHTGVQYAIVMAHMIATVQPAARG
ncbi:mediator of RNA polymerase II transcription subunit 20a [Brassica rapa]|nr:mediator of RNA polymerase II transcription subunit 20a [Brassica rapa]XP_013647645.2 mediator of RNA polymerase II transcription subunit 20a [Brassica napus]